MPCSGRAGKDFPENGNGFYGRGVRTLLPTEFRSLVDRAGLTQAGFARLVGITPRQVNNWCRGRGAVPRWAALLALAIEDVTAEELALRLDEAE